MHPQPRVRMGSGECTRVFTADAPKSPGIPARNGFNGLFRALPGDRYSIHTLRKPTLLQWVSRIRALGHQVLPQSKQVTLMTHIFRRAD